MNVAASFRIVPATQHDVPTILRLIRGLAEYEKLDSEVVASEEGLRAALFGIRPYAEVLLGYAAGEPVGFAVFFSTFSTFRGAPALYIEDLFVEPRWRGRGFGRRLLAHIATAALERGCHRLEWCALDWNEPALGFYRSLGAVQQREWIVHRLSGEPLAQLAAETGRAR